MTVTNLIVAIVAFVVTFIIAYIIGRNCGKHSCQNEISHNENVSFIDANIQWLQNNITKYVDIKYSTKYNLADVVVEHPTPYVKEEFFVDFRKQLEK